VEPWSVREDDRPYLRAPRSAEFWLPALVVVLIVAAAAGYYYYLQSREPAFLVPPPSAPQPAPAAPPQPSAEPAVRHPLDAAAQAPSLPTLANSDSMMRDSVAGLIGRKAFTESVIPAQLVRRIVATVDNLPRPTAPRRMMPLQPVPGAFAVSAGEKTVIDPANFARYAPYVRVLESVNSRALVQTYVRAYPLFQRAYEELGYPGKYFNDRLMAAIDDMLATPEVDRPVELARPKVLYEFADPDLEARSAGQKVLLRMGAHNARRVKAKLAEIRRQLLAAGSPPERAPGQASR
jgi:Protein of unknown function (DUF3014)